MSSFAIEALQRQNAKLRDDLAEANETIRHLREELYCDVTQLPAWLPRLTLHEAKVLVALRSGRTLSKGNIVSAVYVDKVHEPQTKIIDVFVCRIRQKLADTPIYIETVYGQGYRLPADAIELLWPSRREVAA